MKGTLTVTHLEETYEQLKTANLEDIAVHKSISKKFEHYKKTMPQHVKGALFANTILDLQIRNSDTVYLFYINSFVEPDVKVSDRQNVICLRKTDFPLIKDNPKFEIDYYELMEKQIIQPLR